MMSPDIMAQNIAQAFAACRMRSQLSIDALAKRSGCDATVIKMIEGADFDECFKIRENYRDKNSVERRVCDVIKLIPTICIELDDGVIF